MKIITEEDELRHFLPNFFTSVEGEMSLLDKLSTFLETSEEWVKQTFTSETTFNTIAGLDDSNVLKPLLAKVVANHALLAAIPTLDLVLTPNGFGIVSNQNVAPASKERVDRLLASLERERDKAIDLLLLRLPQVTQWLSSEQHSFFTATLFPNLSLCRRLAIREHLWAEYQALRSRLIKIEAVLADTYFSHEQMNVFREKALFQLTNCNPLMLHVVRSLQSLELMLVSDMQVHTQAYFDLVNIIREHADVFPEWHASKVARLYTSPIYKNVKSAGGYWF